MQLNLSHINLGYTDYDNVTTNLISNLSLNLHSGDKLAVLGKNGTGKTTLLKYIFEEFQTQFNLAYVEQQSVILTDTTIVDYLISLNEEWWLIEDKLSELFDYKLVDYTQSIKGLSGGQLTKIHLANAFLKSPEILILDEPTNNLDQESIKSLVKILNNFSGILIFVSHNYSFCKSVGNLFLEIKDKKTTLVRGDLEEFELYKNNLKQAKLRQSEILKKQISNDKEVIDNQIERSKKGYENKRKKFLDGSIDASQWGGLKSSGGNGARRIITKTSEQITTNKQLFNDNRIRNDSRIKFDIQKLKLDPGQTIFSLTGMDLVLNSQNVLVSNINWHLIMGERVALSGANGSGKSVLIRTILGNLIEQKIGTQASSLVLTNDTSKAKIYEHQYGIIDQNYSSLKPNLSVLDNLLEVCQDKIQVRKWLATFKFYDFEQITQITDTLSGGQKARLALAKATINGCDLLVLDEPNNNLDLDSQQELINSLLDFPGAIVCISHDPWFLEQLGITKQYTIYQRTWNESFLD